MEREEGRKGEEGREKKEGIECKGTILILIRLQQ